MGREGPRPLAAPLSLDERLALRLDGPVVGSRGGAGHAGGPQVHAEAGFEAGEGLQVGADQAADDRGHGRVVHLRDRADRAEALAGGGAGQVEGEESGDLDVGIGAGLLGPVWDEVGGDVPAGAGHTVSVGVSPTLGSS